MGGTRTEELRGDGGARKIAVDIVRRKISCWIGWFLVRETAALLG